MTTSNRGERLRYRYGICLNDSCSKCKSKEKQQIAARKEFVCEECGKPLRECPPPAPGFFKKYGKIVIAGVVVALAIVGVVLFAGDKKAGDVATNPPTGDSDTTIVTPDTTVTVKPEGGKTEPPVLNGRGTVNLGYGKYTGDLKNGKPHGWGKITYTKSTKIVNSKDFVANPGDTFEGEFRDGKISAQGYWIHDGNQTIVKP